MPNQTDKDQPQTGQQTSQAAPRQPIDTVQQQSEDSFPASDPPSFTPIRRDGEPSNRDQSGGNRH